MRTMIKSTRAARLLLVAFAHLLFSLATLPFATGAERCKGSPAEVSKDVNDGILWESSYYHVGNNDYCFERRLSIQDPPLARKIKWPVAGIVNPIWVDPSFAAPSCCHVKPRPHHGDLEHWVLSDRRSSFPTKVFRGDDEPYQRTRTTWFSFEGALRTETGKTVLKINLTVRSGYTIDTETKSFTYLYEAVNEGEPIRLAWAAGSTQKVFLELMQKEGFKDGVAFLSKEKSVLKISARLKSQPELRDGIFYIFSPDMDVLAGISRLAYFPE